MGFRYIGSKTKLCDWIISEIQKLSFSSDEPTVIDLMSGTGAIANAMKNAGYNVIANDVMTYSYYHNYVNLKVTEKPQFLGLSFLEKSENRYEEVLCYLNELEGVKGYFYNEFSPEGIPVNGSEPRKYFTSNDAKKIDSIRTTLLTWYENNLITEDEHAILLNDLILAVNDIANIAGTYGHYLSSFSSKRNVDFILKPFDFNFLNTGNQHKVYRKYAEELVSDINGDVCYIDPPYIKRQYAANYHILETLAREDCPQAVGKSGLRPWRDQYSNLCTKTKGLQSFDLIIDRLHCKYILISYSDEGLFPISTLVDTFSKYGNVSIEKMEYKRFKSHAAKEKDYVIEYLIRIEKEN